MQMTEIFDPEYWSTVWDKHNHTYNAWEQEPGFNPGEMWNKRAKGFAANTVGKGGSGRWRQTLDFLQTKMQLEPGKKVLDIGCGPGSFAIPFAQMGLEVTALDPAEQMLVQLQEYLPEDLSGKITPMLGMWEELDVEKLGWAGQFDLVFASMSPGISSQEMLKRMNRCSKGWCYLSTFSGPKVSLLYTEMWRELFGVPLENHRLDVIFPFNALYAMGYAPFITYMDIDSEQEQSVAELLEEAKVMVRRSSVDLSRSGLETEIESFLCSRKDGNGMVRQHRKHTVAMLLWDVNRIRSRG